MFALVFYVSGVVVQKGKTMKPGRGNTPAMFKDSIWEFMDRDLTDFHPRINVIEEKFIIVFNQK